MLEQKVVLKRYFHFIIYITDKNMYYIIQDDRCKFRVNMY